MDTSGSPIGGYVTMEYVAMSALSRLKLGLGHLRSVLQFSIDGYLECGIHHMPSLRTIEVPMGSDNSIPFPHDYISYTKVGITVGGRIILLGYNGNMSVVSNQVCGESIASVYRNPSIISGDPINFVPYYDGSDMVTPKGFGGGFAEAYYREDRLNRRIVIDTAVNSGMITLEYKSTGIEPGQAFIPQMVVPFVRAYTIYYWSEFNKEPNYVVMRRKQDFIEQENLLRSAKKPTVQEFLDTFYSSFALAK